MKIPFLIFLLSLSITGCTMVKKNKEVPLILNAKLYHSYTNLNKTLALKRTPLLFSGGREVDNCRTYDKLTLEKNIDESLYNQQIKSEYLVCDALEILSKSTLEYHKIDDNPKFGKELLSRLDLRSFPSSLNRKSRGKFHTLKMLYPNQASSSNNIVELQTKKWNFSLDIVAVTYVNNNSDPDLIVWVSDESKTGNYKGYSTIVVYDVNKPGLLKASIFPSYLH
ncbi:hypothetical protein MSP8887_04143 [Marinomonas spartinae]|uniref:hypothetical protein n=1 Tax=Marinomonas spartinae TaxID=1792290 RepID=UPI000808E95C|nr:hypothetical protein [Marinomonas spartinae]SBS40037.1 hypothetical protein MSP8887_04143 [Marinomonas spartinae]